MKSKYYVLSLVYNEKRDTYYPYLCYYESGFLRTMTLPVGELCVLSQKDTVEILMDITTSTPYFVHNPHDSFICSMPKSYVA